MKRGFKRQQEENKDLNMREPYMAISLFLCRNLQARREWQYMFRVLKGKNLQPRILYPVRLSIKIEGEIKNFSDKQKLKEYYNSKPILKELLKGLF